MYLNLYLISVGRARYIFVNVGNRPPPVIQGNRPPALSSCSLIPADEIRILVGEAIIIVEVSIQNK